MTDLVKGGFDTGCVIKTECVDSFMECYIRHNPREFEGADDPKGIMEEKLYYNDFIGTTEFEGVEFIAQLFKEDPHYDTAELYSLQTSCEEIPMPFILVRCEKYLTTKDVIKNGFYKSTDEIVEEFRRKLHRYLPEDFDYEGSIGDITYAIW